MVLNESFLRMQKLAGLPVNNNHKLILEGIKIFVEIMSSNLLTEAEKKEATNSTAELIDELPSEALTFYKTLGIVYDQLDSEGQKLLADVFKELKSGKISKEELTQRLGLNKNIEEAEEDESEADAVGKLGKWLRKSGLGKAVKNTIAGLTIAVLTIPSIFNTIQALTPKDVQQVSQTISYNENADSGNSTYPTAEEAKTDASKVGVETSDGTLVVPFKLAQGNKAGIKDIKIIDNFVKALKAKYADKSVSGTIKLKVKGYASNTDGKNNAENEKSKTSNKPLSQERTKTIQDLIPKKIGNVNIELEIEKGNYNDLAKETTKTDSKGNQIGGTDGAVVTIDQTDSSLEQTKTSTKEIPKTFVDTYQPSYAPYGSEPSPEVPKDGGPEGEIGGPEGGAGGPGGGVGGPGGKGPESGAGGGKTDTTSGVTSVSRTKEYLKFFPELNRNGQIATVLSAVSPKTNIYNKLGLEQIKSFTDAELKAVTDPEAKKIANLILNLRKNPDTLLNKMKTAVGINLGTRAKAVQTTPGQKYKPSSQLQKPVSETISLSELLNEAVIDNVFSDLGISDADIKKNKIALLALLGSMYAQQGNTSLSVLDPKELTPEEQEELKDLGFSPQGAKGEYVFLGLGKTKKDVVFDKKLQAFKTQNDVNNILKAIEQRPSLKKQLAKINNETELSQLIISVLKKTNPEVASDNEKLKAILTNISSRLSDEIIMEVDKEQADVLNTSTAIDKDNLVKNLFGKINSSEEAIQSILRALLKYIDPSLQQKNRIISAINRAKAALSKK